MFEADLISAMALCRHLCGQLNTSALRVKRTPPSANLMSANGPCRTFSLIRSLADLVSAVVIEPMLQCAGTLVELKGTTNCNSLNW